jgi:hypothetical protein
LEGKQGGRTSPPYSVPQKTLHIGSFLKPLKKKNKKTPQEKDDNNNNNNNYYYLVQ